MDLIVFEDDDLLVADKPSGWNTHAPSPFANEGVYDWLKHRETRWRKLSILHRLDKETSGLIVFGKTTEANRSLTRQFENRQVSKKYLFLTDRPSPKSGMTTRSYIARDGSHYISRATGESTAQAETRFKFIGAEGKNFLWQAEPQTGRTHQIRVHARENGIPILGDTVYGGSVAPRLCLHAAELSFAHPLTEKKVTFNSEPKFSEAAFGKLRSAIIDTAETNAYRLVHGAADGWPGLYIDRWDQYLLASSENDPSAEEMAFIRSLAARGVYHKYLAHQPGKGSAQLICGEGAPDEGFVILENGVVYKIGFAEGYSVGLFLDQRDNRRRLLTGHVSADLSLPPLREVLNVFAYTCGFSVCAAQSGAKITSIDLSRKYLDWGCENLRANKLTVENHEFLSGDAFDWMSRLGRKKRRFDLVILDPPTFSRSKQSGVFQAERHYGRLVSAAIPLIKPGGVLFASTNSANYRGEDFLADVTQAIRQCGRGIACQYYAPQPPDFPIHNDEPAYLKTLWVFLTG